MATRIGASTYALENERDFYKGTSFRYNYDWNAASYYFNDEYFIDFVSYNGKMYVCKASNTGVVPTDINHWAMVMEGQVGPKGDVGTIFVPAIDANGNLTWSNSAGLPNPMARNIKGTKGDQGEKGDIGSDGKKGDKGEQGEKGTRGPIGMGLEFAWDGTFLGVKRQDMNDYFYVNLKGDMGPQGKKGDKGEKGDKGDKGEKGERGPAVKVRKSQTRSGNNILQVSSDGIDWENILNLEDLRGKRGRSMVLKRNMNTGNIEYTYVDSEATPDSGIMSLASPMAGTFNDDTGVLVYKDDIKGPKGDTIARTYVGDDGYLYIQLSSETKPRRAGYVRGDKGADGRQVILRIDNDKNLDEGESGTGTHLQWKYAGDEYKLWTNLIQVNELFNIAIAGLKLEHEIVKHEDESGIMTTYNRTSLTSWKVDYDSDGTLILTDKINTISQFDSPISSTLLDVYYDYDTAELVFIIDESTGEREVRVPVNITSYQPGDGIQFVGGQHIAVKIDPTSQKQSDGVTSILTVSSDGLKVSGITGVSIDTFLLDKEETPGDVDVYKYIITTDDGNTFEADFPADKIIANIEYSSADSKMYAYFLDDLLGDVHKIEIPIQTTIEIDPDSEKIETVDILSISTDGLKITGLIDKLIKSFEFVTTPNPDPDLPPTTKYVITAVDGTTYSANFPGMELFSHAEYDATTHILHLFFYNDKTGDYDDIQINLEDLVDVYGVKTDGGLDMTNDGLFFIKEKGIVEEMLSDDLLEMIHNSVEEVTYDELDELVTNGELTPGVLYLITDFQTIYSQNSIVLGTTASAYPSDVYHLVVQALSETILSTDASILEHPDWEVRYQMTHKIPEDKGVITYLVDGKGNTADYDFYNIHWHWTANELTSTPNFPVVLNPGVNDVYIPTFSKINAAGTSVNLIKNSSYDIYDVVIRKSNKIAVVIENTSGKIANILFKECDTLLVKTYSYIYDNIFDRCVNTYLFTNLFKSDNEFRNLSNVKSDCSIGTNNKLINLASCNFVGTALFKCIEDSNIFKDLNSCVFNGMIQNSIIDSCKINASDIYHSNLQGVADLSFNVLSIPNMDNVIIDRVLFINSTVFTSIDALLGGYSHIQKTITSDGTTHYILKYLDPDRLTDQILIFA